MTVTAHVPGDTVLVVEDDGVAFPLRCVLERAGHHVERVRRLTDATRGRGPVGLVVVDVVEHDLRGLVRDLRAISCVPAVLLLTPGPGNRGTTQLAGDVALLPKPFALADFQACLRALLGQTPARVPDPQRRAECEDVGLQTVVGQVPQNVV